jgi:peptide/nickel transport system substrate-binding protein
VTSVEIVDDHTVKLVLKAPFAPLLAALSDRAGMIVSPKAAQMAGDFSTHPVCAGPYKFVERVAQDRIVVERFADYGTRTRCISIASSFCRSRIPPCVWPIYSPAGST